MKFNSIKALVIALFIAGIISSCSKEDDDIVNELPDNIVYIESEVSSPTTWFADSVYIIKDYDFYISSTLTIQPGTVIKFDADAPDMYLGMGGTIIAHGTSSNPIIFTSFKDDNWGGDTNGDGSSTSPSIGDWGIITTNGENGSIFEYCHFYYGGGTSYTSSLELYGNNIQVSNCVFAYNSGSDGTGFYGALSAIYGGPDCVITNNTFFSNVRPLSIGTAFSLDDSNIFHDPENSSNTNTYNGVFVYSGDEITSHISWGETEVPFVINDNDFWIYSDGILTLADDVVLKFKSGSEMVLDRGTSSIVNYNGSGVYFTSYKDDDKKGDTNGDLSATSASTGDWYGIYDNTSSQHFSWPNILYASGD